MMGENHGVESSTKGIGEIVSDSSPFDSLPEDCISNIMSFISPRDACVFASVSKTFESAANSDVIWEKFLPPEYPSLIPPWRVLSSKKELYFALCDEPVLIEDGKKSFWLEKASGKRCIMLSAESLYIKWGDSNDCWNWIPCPQARFKKVAKLRDVCWFEVRGRTNTRVLSPRTRYSAYLVFKAYGFDVIVEAGVGVVGKQACTRFLCLDPRAGEDVQFVRRGRRKMKIVTPEEREDGWMEIELGGFFNKGRLMISDEVEMSALGTEQREWKTGLIIQGIEIRPARIPT